MLGISSCYCLILINSTSFRDKKYATGCGSSGWHPQRASLPKSSPAPTLFPGKKGCFDENRFCCRAFILSPWETYCKHWLNTLHAQIEKLHLPIQSWIPLPKHYIYFYISLFRRAERKQTSCILSAFGSWKGFLQTFFHRCSHSPCFISPSMNKLCKKKKIYSRNSWLRVLLRLYHGITWPESWEGNLFRNIIIITVAVLKYCFSIYTLLLLNSTKHTV